ncbi:hypothetical protein LTR08_002329 [Meristemomyces frigidus]|nr:hypothetical protein LTR08_002329 [Meristemomyces frigidus]
MAPAFTGPLNVDGPGSAIRRLALQGRSQLVFERPLTEVAETRFPCSPKATWQATHDDKPDEAVCAYSRRANKLSAQQKKLPLVAERLSWAASTFGVKARSQNEEALWSVDYELGIRELVELSSREDDVWRAAGAVAIDGIHSGARPRPNLLCCWPSRRRARFVERGSHGRRGNNWPTHASAAGLW